MCKRNRVRWQSNVLRALDRVARECKRYADDFRLGQDAAEFVDHANTERVRTRGRKRNALGSGNRL